MPIFYIFRHFKFIKTLFNNDNANRNNYHYPDGVTKDIF